MTSESDSEEILRLGRENPLSHDEAVRLMTAIVVRLQASASRRGRPITGLSGDPKTIAEQIVDRNR
jgi:hypothetical protein